MMQADQPAKGTEIRMPSWSDLLEGRQCIPNISVRSLLVTEACSSNSCTRLAPHNGSRSATSSS